MRISAEIMGPNSVHISKLSGVTFSEPVDLVSDFSQTIDILGSFSVDSASNCDYLEGVSFFAPWSVSVGRSLMLAECIERRERSLRQCNVLERTHRQNLAQKEWELEKRHPDTLASMSNLALVLIGQENYTAGEYYAKDAQLERSGTGRRALVHTSE